MNILVTGGAGYIGSHTVVSLIEAGHSVVVVDNLVNSSRLALDRIKEITGFSVPFYEVDVDDALSLETVFSNHHFDSVLHFAGLKAVGESVKHPLLYYRQNIDDTLTLLEVMNHHNVKNLIFSSSATVYGSAPIPYKESGPVGQGITNPYGKTKYFIEEILRDLAASDSEWHISALRYFNPIGAHPSGLIGEDPKGIPNNLMPYLTQVVGGLHDKLSIFGGDYDTPDGTGIRDYIHVVDVAEGHLAALDKQQAGFHVYNLSMGRGTSVLELVATFEKATGQKIPYEIVGRREGDLPSYYADSSFTEETLRWKARLSLDDACRDAWAWQSKNPNGYKA